MQRTDLFGAKRDVIRPAIESLGTWPFTVWEIDEGAAGDVHRRVRDIVGDQRDWAKLGTTGGTSFPDTNRKYAPSGRAHAVARANRHAAVDGTYGFQHGASIFSPVVGGMALAMYAPHAAPGAAAPLCIDPFAGGGTRPVLAARWGLRYIGLEIRQEEVDFCNERIAALGIDRATARVVLGDAREVDKHIGYGVGDFLLTCPPYYDLEVYGGGPRDLSTLPTYGHFADAIAEVAIACHRALRPGAVAVWVVGLHRDKGGVLLPIHHDVVHAHLRAGFKVKEEVILYRRHSGAGTRTRNFFMGKGFLARTHEYALVFVR